MLITATAAAATATLTVSSASTSTAADADTLSTRSCDWRYLSEGKLNVVFTHAHATEAAAPARGVDSQLSPQQQQQTERIHSSVPHAMVSNERQPQQHSESAGGFVLPTLPASGEADAAVAGLLSVWRRLVAC
jgi:hypothetical protein